MTLARSGSTAPESLQGPAAVEASGAPALEVHQVSLNYGAHQVLHQVSLSVAAGHTTAIVGPSGSGKTSLLRVIAGFLRPDSGEVALHGKQVTKTAAHRRSIGLVSQDGALFPHLSVGRNIAFGLPRRQRTVTAVSDLLDLVSLPAEYARRRPDQLSGGQRQRVSLARAMARQPDIILLDEPFSALDAGLRERTRKAVQKVLRSTGTTALLVTHDQDEALSFAQSVAVLQGGRVQQMGAPERVYQYPVNVATAEFLGEAVVLSATVTAPHRAACVLGEVTLRQAAAEGRAQLLLRPEQLMVVPAREENLGQVLDADYFGHDTTALIRIHGSGETVRVRQLNSAPLHIGDAVGLEVTGTGVAFPG